MPRSRAVHGDREAPPVAASDTEAFSSDASSVAAVIASRFAAALSRVPYLAAMTSPCSVMRMRPLHRAGRLRADRGER